MTDIINVKKAFAYALESSSINYVRNYNFNAATVTDIRLNLFNKDQTTPITVYMSGSVPWVKIKNSNNTDITFPKGNIVLPPSSSQTVLVQIDLPTEIEAVETIAVYPDIRFRVISGSFPITSSAPPPNTNAIVLNQDLVTVEVNKQSDLIEAYVYDANGLLEASPEVVWTSNNTSIVQIDEEKQGDGESSQIDLSKNTQRYLRGVSPGQTTVRVTSGNRTAQIRVTVVTPTPASAPPPSSAPPADSQS
jgi:hypothetical protein